ncbi:MAG: transposase [Alphaproteobacteria bacterium]|nr:MAG: transposase [Alphaproteobacteria bacterium]
MSRNRVHTLEFKRQVVAEFLSGATLYALAKRHEISRNLIRVWIAKYQAGALDDDAYAANMMNAQEAKIAALERLVGRQALELEFLRGALKSKPQPKDAPTFVIAGPLASPSHKDAG